MATITFSEITERIAEHQRAEDARNAPIAVARRAIYTLSALIADLTDAEAVELLTLIDEEVMAPIAAREARP